METKKQFQWYVPLQKNTLTDVNYELNDDGTLDIEGIASTINKDLQGDVMLPSAIASMKKQILAMGKNLHGDHKPFLFDGLLGAVNKVYETDDDKLKIGATILSKYASDVKEMLDIGVNLGFSVGGAMKEYNINKSNGLDISDVYLSEVSLTAIPANVETLGTVTTQKGAIMFRYGLVGNLNYKSLVPKTETQKTTTEVKEVSKTIKNADIYTLANTVKTSVEKNKKLETSFKIGNVSYTSSEVAYAFSYAINNLSSDCTIPSLKAYASDTGDSMNEQVIPSDVKDQAKRIVQYIKQNGQCPNYVTTVKSKKRASVKMFVYAFARTLVWYKNHSKTFPNYTTYDTSAFSSSSTSTTSNGLYSYMTSQGCSGMGQCNGYNCGPNSLQQCLYRLTGIKVAESTIASWAGTTTSGTDHEGLNTAVAKFNKTYGKNIKITWKNFSELGSSLDARCKALQSYIDKGAVFVHLLYRNQYGHYEVVKSATSDPLSILNSLGDKCSSPAYCGYIESRSRSTQQSYINGISQKSIAILTK